LAKVFKQAKGTLGSINAIWGNKCSREALFDPPRGSCRQELGHGRGTCCCVWTSLEEDVPWVANYAHNAGPNGFIKTSLYIICRPPEQRFLGATLPQEVVWCASCCQHLIAISGVPKRHSTARRSAGEGR